jgi:predicted metal-binding protein
MEIKNECDTLKADEERSSIAEILGKNATLVGENCIVCAFCSGKFFTEESFTSKKLNFLKTVHFNNCSSERGFRFEISDVMRKKEVPMGQSLPVRKEVPMVQSLSVNRNETPSTSSSKRFKKNFESTDGYDLVKVTRPVPSFSTKCGSCGDIVEYRNIEHHLKEKHKWEGTTNMRFYGMKAVNIPVPISPIYVSGQNPRNKIRDEKNDDLIIGI